MAAATPMLNVQDEVEDSVKYVDHDILLKYAFGPMKSVTAKITLESLINVAKAENLMENYKEGSGDEDKIITHLADSLKSGFSTRVTPTPSIVINAKPHLEKVLEKIEKSGNEKSELDISARIVKIFFDHSTPTAKAYAYHDECIEKYPDDPFFYNSKLDLFNLCEVEEERYKFALEAVKKFPEHSEILFHHFCSFSKLISDEVVQNNFETEKFLENMKKLEELGEKIMAVTPEDNQMATVLYYGIAFHYHAYILNEMKLAKDKNEFYILDSNLPMFLTLKKYYEKGLKSEEIQLPHTKANQIEEKSYLKEFMETHSKTPDPKYFTKERLDMVVKHRVNLNERRTTQINLNDLFENKCDLGGSDDQVLEKDELEQIRNEALAGLDKIDLKNLDIKKEQIYKGFYVELTIVEDPDFDDDTIMLVGQEGDSFHRIVVKNFDKNKNIDQFLGFGCKIIITHPKLNEDEDGKVIEVDDLKTLILSGEKDLKRCRWCGESNAKLSCSKCKRKYCKRECQLMDWKILKHSLICEQQISK